MLAETAQSQCRWPAPDVLQHEFVDDAPGPRTVPFERSGVIAYVVPETVEIVNVFYGGRDYEALYNAEEQASSSVKM